MNGLVLIDYAHRLSFFVAFCWCFVYLIRIRKILELIKLSPDNVFSGHIGIDVWDGAVDRFQLSLIIVGLLKMPDSIDAKISKEMSIARRYLSFALGGMILSIGLVIYLLLNGYYQKPV